MSTVYIRVRRVPWRGGEVLTEDGSNPNGGLECPRKKNDEYENNVHCASSNTQYVASRHGRPIKSKKIGKFRQGRVRSDSGRVFEPRVCYQYIPMACIWKRRRTTYRTGGSGSGNRLIGCPDPQTYTVFITVIRATYIFFPRGLSHRHRPTTCPSPYMRCAQMSRSLV